MPSPVLGIGSAPNDGTGDPIRTAFQKMNRQPLFDSMLNAGSGDYTGTNEAKITACIADAAVQGKQGVWIPNSMRPYTASLVTYNNAVQLFREGGIIDGSLFDVQAYGAAGNDSQDDTVAFQAAADAAKANTATLYIAGDRGGANQALYRINGTVNITGSNRRVIQDFGGSIKCYNATGPALWFRGSAAGGVAQQFTHVFGLNMQSAIDGYKQPLVTFGDASGCSYLNVENCFMDLKSSFRDGIWLWSVYNAGLLNVTQINNGGGRACLYRNDPSLNVGNINFLNWVSPVASIMFAVQEYYGLSNNLINSLHFDNCKDAGDPGVTNKFFAGTVAGNQAINSTTITLSGGQGANYATGDWIVVIHAGTYWSDRVASVAGDVLTLTDSAGTAFALTANDPVIVGRWHTVLGPNVKQVRYDMPHLERCNGVLGTNSVQGVVINRPLIGANIFRGAYVAQGCQDWMLEQAIGATDLGSGGILFHQANDANNSRNRLVGPNNFSGTQGNTAQKLIQMDGGTHCTYENRRTVVANTGNYTIVQNDYEVHVDASGAISTVTIPAPANVRGMELVIKKTDGSTNAVIITPASGTVDGLTSAFLKVQHQQAKLINDGSNWFVVSGARVPPILYKNGELSTGSASDVSIASVVLDGGMLGVTGDAVRLTMRGIASGGNGTPNIKFGATVVVTGTVTSGNAYEIQVTVSRSGAAVQRAVGFLINGTAIAAETRSGPTETLANNITIDFRGAITAGTLTADHVLVEYLAR